VRPGGFLTRHTILRPDAQRSAFFLHITLTVSLFLFAVVVFTRRVTRMTEEKTTRELGFTRRTGT